MRKLLTKAAVILFAVSVAEQFIPVGLPTEKSAVVESTVSTEKPQKVYTVSSEGIFENQKERFVAHRGFSEHAPENSVPAFELAGKAGFWGIESDIIEAADGVFMCMHDDTLDRTTDGEGEVSGYTYTELMDFRIDFGNDIEKYPDLKIPTMIEFLNNCVIYDCVPIIEIKSIVDYEAFLRTIKESGLYKRAIVTGGIEALKQIRALDSEINIMLVAYATNDYSVYEALLPDLGANSGILLNAPLITQEVSNSLHERGYRIGAWTLDSKEDAQKYIDLGADYVVTNEIPGLKHMINTNE